MSPDIINGLFELVGTIFMGLSICKVLKDKEVKGVYWPGTGFFTIWGAWNIFYYPSLGQWYSFAAGILLFTSNTIYVVLLIKYSRSNIEIWDDLE